MREYRTAEVAKIIGIHPNTVRFYEEWGLITKPVRKENGYRVFTDLQIRQIRMARFAFRIEVLQNGLRKKMIDVIKTSANCDFDEAIRLLGDYRMQLQKETTNAEEAIRIVQTIVSGTTTEDDRLWKRKEAAEYLGLTTDTLRNWEMNGLLSVKRKDNGYRVYTAKDMRRLKIIRSLRCANYSLEAILRMLQQTNDNPQADIRALLNTPTSDEDIISACDRLLISLAKADENALVVLGMLQEMKADKR